MEELIDRSKHILTKMDMERTFVDTEKKVQDFALKPKCDGFEVPLKKKNPLEFLLKGLLVAGAGLEPATFGL